MDESGEIIIQNRQRSCSPRFRVLDQLDSSQNFQASDSQASAMNSPSESINNDGLLRAINQISEQINVLSEESKSMRNQIHCIENRIDNQSSNTNESRSSLGSHVNHSSPYNGSNRNENHTAPRLIHRHEPPHEHRHMNKSYTKLKPQMYDGNEDFEEYLSQFEIIADINQWDYREKSLYLAGSLGGNARAILTELSPLERQDFDSLVNILNIRYGSIERSEMFRARLQTKTRGKDETLSELAQSIRKLTRQAYPTADSSLTNILALDHFIDSIPDSDIRLRIRELRPKNINEAETHAVRLEAHRLADKQRGKSLHVTQRSVYQTQTQSPQHYIETDGEQVSVGALTRSILNLERTTKHLITTLGQNDRPQSHNNRQRNVWNGNGNQMNQNHFHQNQSQSYRHQSRGDNRWQSKPQKPSYQNQQGGQNQNFRNQPSSQSHGHTNQRQGRQLSNDSQTQNQLRPDPIYSSTNQSTDQNGQGNF